MLAVALIVLVALNSVAGIIYFIRAWRRGVIKPGYSYQDDLKLCARSGDKVARIILLCQWVLVFFVIFTLAQLVVSMMSNGFK